MATTPAPTLVVLAAGLGRRFGGDKQATGIGPHGEWLVDYAVDDAIAAGFGRVVAVTRTELREELERRLAARVGARAELRCVLQRNDDVPNGCAAPHGRLKPLGTGHALWCARGALDTAFAVVNADDYYGRDAYRRLAGHFRAHATSAMVGFRLDRTLSPHGGVNRGICTTRADGSLDRVVEWTDIREGADGGLDGVDAHGVRRPLARETIVSLNCWGLRPEFLPTLERGLRDFLAHAGGGDEYYLPAAIDRHLAASGERLAVLESGEAWLGLTYPEDRAQVAARLASLRADG